LAQSHRGGPAGRRPGWPRHVLQRGAGPRERLREGGQFQPLVAVASTIRRVSEQPTSAAPPRLGDDQREFLPRLQRHPCHRPRGRVTTDAASWTDALAVLQP